MNANEGKLVLTLGELSQQECHEIAIKAPDIHELQLMAFGLDVTRRQT